MDRTPNSLLPALADVTVACSSSRQSTMLVAELRFQEGQALAPEDKDALKAGLIAFLELLCARN
jgi:hypothetical protein